MKPQVPIDVEENTGVWTTDGLPMLYMPRHFFVNNHTAIEDALGREKYSELLYEAGHRSAYYWCDKEARAHHLEGLAVYQHYLNRLSQRGWGRFSFQSVDAATGHAEIMLEYSSFVLAEPEKPGKLCYMFSGWFAGAMDWVIKQEGRSVCTACTEARCRGEGHTHCTFTVKPLAPQLEP